MNAGSADAGFFPRFEHLFDDFGNSERPLAQRVLIRAVEMALDNGEFDGITPTRDQWGDLGGRHVYVAQAEAELSSSSRSGEPR